jgi:tryptophan 2,3-dioxygenase
MTEVNNAVKTSVVCSAGTNKQNSMAKYQMEEEAAEPCAWECEEYEHYVQLPQLSLLWNSREWPAWHNEQLVKPALQALEMSFRLISSILCDSRPYVNKEEWARRLESVIGNQLELISIICQDDQCAPTVQLAVSSGILGMGAAQEVWQRPGALAVVSRSSEESLLPRLATWKRAENLVRRIGLAIECHMQRAPFTLGLGEPNLCGKPILDYDRVCQPSYVCSLKRTPAQGNGEDNTLRTAHQILECWLFSAGMLVNRIEEKVNSGDLKGAAKDSWVVERTWKLLAETANLLLLMDPDDFLRLKQLLAMDSSTGAYCLRSRALRDLTRACKNLSHLVPRVVRVDADPKGGPRLQQAVMNLFHSHGSSSAKMETSSSEFPCVPSTAIHLLQAFQAIEAAVRRFFFSYQQLVITVMGSVEMKRSSYRPDGLTQIYLEPPYFPSLDGAKAFLGDYCRHNYTLNSNAISLNLSMCSVPSDDSMTLVDSFNSEPDQRYQPHDKFRRG